MEAALAATLAALVLLLLHPKQTQTQESSAPIQNTLCAIGDLHADLKHTKTALALCGAVHEHNHTWIANRNVTVVQTGDVVDRGQESLETLGFLLELQKQAKGELVLLMGNHELLNLQGKLQYVHGYSRRSSDSGEIAAQGGRVVWKARFNPISGDIGQKLAHFPAVAVRGQGACRTLFVHAGVRETTARNYGSIEAINEALREQVQQGTGDLLDPLYGPLWFRGYARSKEASNTESDVCTELAATLDLLENASRMAVGHNIVPWVTTRCGGRLHLLDIGMSSYYGGKPGVWRCREQGEKAVIETLYAGDEEASSIVDLCEACSDVRPRSAMRLEDLQDCVEFCGASRL